MKKVRVAIALIFLASIVIAFTGQSFAYPPFVQKAARFGAKDCRFCHVKAGGGEPFNARGKWLIKEKARRHAEAVDPEWLSNYKSSKRK